MASRSKDEEYALVYFRKPEVDDQDNEAEEYYASDPPMQGRDYERPRHSASSTYYEDSKYHYDDEYQPKLYPHEHRYANTPYMRGSSTFPSAGRRPSMRYYSTRDERSQPSHQTYSGHLNIPRAERISYSSIRDTGDEYLDELRKAERRAMFDEKVNQDLEEYSRARKEAERQQVKAELELADEEAEYRRDRLARLDRSRRRR